MFVQNITMLELDRPNRDIPADFFVVFVTENTEKEKEPFLVLGWQISVDKTFRLIISRLQ